MESSSSAKIRGTVGQAGIGSNAWNRQLLRSDNNMFAMLAKQDGAEDSVVSYYSDSDDNTDDMMEFTEVQSRKGKRQRMSSSGRSGNQDEQDLGFVSVGVRFEPREGLLHVMVDQAKALPQHQLTGPPDPYVRVEVAQSAHTPTKKQTTTKRKTSHPVFDETFTFSVSPRIDDLTYTSLNIMVFDHDRIRSDDVIGRVVLGNGSTEASEFDHWSEILANPGHLVTKWHYLVELDD